MDGTEPEWERERKASRIDYLPSPEEIAQRAAAVRAGWSKCEESRRVVGLQPEPLEVTQVGVRAMSAKTPRRIRND